MPQKKVSATIHVTAVIDGQNGQNGIDAQDIEWAYIRTKGNTQPRIADSSETDSNGKELADDDYMPSAYIESTVAGGIEANDINTSEHPNTYGSNNYICGECTDDPKGVNDEWPYEWEIKREKGTADANGHRDWTAYSGTMTLHNNLAASLLTIDIDNDSDQFGVDADGKVLVQQARSTVVSMAYGTEPQAFTAAPTASLRYDDGTTVPTSVATAAVAVVANTDNTQYRVTVTVKATDTNTPVFGTSGKNGLYVDISGTCAKGGPKTIRFSLNKVMGGASGENPVIWQLNPSKKSFVFGRDASNNLTPASVSSSIYVTRTEGNTTTEHTDTSGLTNPPTFSWGFDDETTAQASGQAIGDPISISNTQAASHSSVWVKLSTGDRETLPILKDGAKGESGSNGDTPMQAFQWNQSADTAPTPLPDGATLGSWSAAAPNRPGNGYYLWMTQTTKHTATDGTVRYDAWSPAVCISGADGTPGEDAPDKEWIYRLTTGTAPSLPTSTAQDKKTDGYVPQDWTNHPTGVDSTNVSEYACYRTKPAGTGEREWSEWKGKTGGQSGDAPILWSHYGRNGIDGDGTEYVFIRTKNNVPPIIITSASDKDSQNRTYKDDEYLPQVYGNVQGGGNRTDIEVNGGTESYPECTDNPQGTSSTWKYEWVAKRTKDDAAADGSRSWKNYTTGQEMSIFSNWAEDGNGIQSVVRTYAISSQATTASDTTPPSDVTTWAAASSATTVEKPYLWTKEVVTYTKAASTTKYYMIGARGQNGIDAQDFEWAYIRTKTNTAPVIAADSSYTDSKGKTYTADDHLPHVTGNSNIESNNSGVSGKTYECTDDPKGVNDEWPYEWEIKREKGTADANGHRDWTAYSGTMTLHNNLAASLLTIDIDNDSDQFGVDADGKVLTQQTRSTVVTMAYGTALQQFTTAPTASLRYDDGTTVATSVATAAVAVVANTDNTQYRVTVTVKATDTNTPVFGTSGKNGLYVDISGTCAKGGPKTIRFSLNKVMGGASGENPVIWQLNPSKKSFVFGRDASNNLTPASVSSSIYVTRTEGNTTTEHTDTSGLTNPPTFSWGFDSESTAQYSGQAIGTAIDINNTQAASHSSVWVKLSTGDRETLPILKDGAKGENGSNGDTYRTVQVFYDNVLQPETPTGSTIPPAGWSLEPPILQVTDYFADRGSMEINGQTYSSVIMAKAKNTSQMYFRQRIAVEPTSSSDTISIDILYKSLMYVGSMVMGITPRDVRYEDIGGFDSSQFLYTLNANGVGDYKRTCSLTIPGDGKSHFWDVVCVSVYMSDNRLRGYGGMTMNGYLFIGPIKIYTSFGTFKNGILQGTWSEPVQWNGTNGAQGEKGEDGQPGAPAVVYSLQCSPAAVNFRSDAVGEFYGSYTVVCKVMKTVGNITTEVTASGGTYDGNYLKYRTLNSNGTYNSWVSSNSISLDMSNASIAQALKNGLVGVEFALSDSSEMTSVKVSASVPIMLDGHRGAKGEQGEQGQQGEQGATGKMFYPMGTYDPATTYTRTDDLIPLVFFDDGIANYNKVNSARGHYYFLKANSNVSGSTHYAPAAADGKGKTYPYSGTVWEIATDFGLVITQGIFAEFAKLGKAIMSGDYLFSMNGRIGTTNYNTGATWGGKPAYTLFVGDPGKKVVAESGTKYVTTTYSPNYNLFSKHLSVNAGETLLVSVLLSKTATVSLFWVSGSSQQTVEWSTNTTTWSSSKDVWMSAETTYYLRFTSSAGGAYNLRIKSSSPKNINYSVERIAFQPNWWVDLLTGKMSAARGNFVVDANGDVMIDGVIRSKNLYRNVCIFMDGGGYSSDWWYVAQITDGTPAGLKVGDYFTGEFPDPANNSHDGMIRCAYGADTIIMVPVVSGYKWRYNTAVMLPDPTTFDGKTVEILCKADGANSGISILVGCVVSDAFRLYAYYDGTQMQYPTASSIDRLTMTPTHFEIMYSLSGGNYQMAGYKEVVGKMVLHAENGKWLRIE